MTVESYVTSFDVANIYPYGARVYGTHQVHSKHIYFVVVHDELEKRVCIQDDTHTLFVYSTKLFEQLLSQHASCALECVFLPKKQIVKEAISYTPIIHRSLLHRSFAEQAERAWKKARNLLTSSATLTPDSTHTAQQHLYHAFHLYMMGADISTHGYITNYHMASSYWHAIQEAPLSTWSACEKELTPLLAAVKNDFHAACPN